MFRFESNYLHTRSALRREKGIHIQVYIARSFMMCKGKGKAHPCTGTEALYRRTARSGSRGIALPFHDHGTRRGWGVSVAPWPLFTPRKDQVPILQEAGWAPGPVWTGAENLAPHRDSIPGPSSPNQSLYRLRSPAHFYDLYSTLNIFWVSKCRIMRWTW